MPEYTAYIKNITTGEWLQNEVGGVLTHTKEDDMKLVFSGEEDAESTLEYLNQNFSDAYVLLDDSQELSEYSYFNGVNTGHNPQ